MTATRSPAFSKKVLVLDDQGTTTCHHRPFPARTGRLDATPTGNKVPDENDRPTVLSILPQCSIKAGDRLRHGKRLGKEADRPGLHRARADAFIGECRDEDEGRGVSRACARSPAAQGRSSVTSAGPRLRTTCHSNRPIPETPRPTRTYARRSQTTASKRGPMHGHRRPK
jgi:hypothetical protein